jgi:hypothetical protein
MIERSRGFASHFMHLIKFIIRSIDSTMDLGTFNCILRDEEDGSGAGLILDSDNNGDVEDEAHIVKAVVKKSHKKKPQSRGAPRKDRKHSLATPRKLKHQEVLNAGQNRKKSQAELQFEYNLAIINIKRIEELLGIPTEKRIEAELGLGLGFGNQRGTDSKVLGKGSNYPPLALGLRTLELRIHL